MNIQFEEGDGLFEAVKDAIIENIDTSDLEDKVIDKVCEEQSIDADDIAEKIAEKAIGDFDMDLVINKVAENVFEDINIVDLCKEIAATMVAGLDQAFVYDKAAEILAGRADNPSNANVGSLQQRVTDLVNTNIILTQDIVTHTHTIQALERRLFTMEQLLGKFREVLVR